MPGRLAIFRRASVNPAGWDNGSNKRKVPATAATQLPLSFPGAAWESVELLSEPQINADEGITQMIKMASMKLSA
jgi:hypothetical protein